MDAEKRRYRAACPKDIKMLIQDAIDAGFEVGRYSVAEREEAEQRAFLLGRRKPPVPGKPYASRDKAYCLIGKLQVSYDDLQEKYYALLKERV